MAAPQELHALTSQWYDTNPELEDGGLKILDIGGGAGPYSFALPARGHSVTLVDLSPGLLAITRTRAAIPELAGERGTFDAVLLLGPLYHIMSPALRAAWAMVRAGGGTLACAWVSRWAHYRDAALAAQGAFYAQHARDGDNVRVDAQGVASRMVGAEGLLVGGLDRLVNELEGEEFEAWVDKCYEVGTDAHGWAMADHIVGIVSKP